MLRGTGWRGLSSLRSRGDLIRPLLAIPKAELIAYAQHQGVQWRHDSTNDVFDYMRNRVRYELLSRLPNEIKNQMYQYIVRQNHLTDQIDTEIDKWLREYLRSSSPAVALPRYEFIMLPQHVAHKLLQEVLRRKIGKSLPRPLARAALLFVKVAKSHKTFPLDTHWQLRALRREVIVEPRSTVVSLNNAGFHKEPTIINKGRTHFETETTK